MISRVYFILLEILGSSYPEDEDKEDDSHPEDEDARHIGEAVESAGIGCPVGVQAVLQDHVGHHEGGHQVS